MPPRTTTVKSPDGKGDGIVAGPQDTEKRSRSTIAHRTTAHGTRGVWTGPSERDLGEGPRTGTARRYISDKNSGFALSCTTR